MWLAQGDNPSRENHLSCLRQSLLHRGRINCNFQVRLGRRRLLVNGVVTTPVRHAVSLLVERHLDAPESSVVRLLLRRIGEQVIVRAQIRRRLHRFRQVICVFECFPAGLARHLIHRRIYHHPVVSQLIDSLVQGARRHNGARLIRPPNRHVRYGRRCRSRQSHRGGIQSLVDARLNLHRQPARVHRIHGDVRFRQKICGLPNKIGIRPRDKRQVRCIDVGLVIGDKSQGKGSRQPDQALSSRGRLKIVCQRGKAVGGDESAPV